MSVPDFVIQNCIAWNEAALAQAERDSQDRNLTVPPSAFKLVQRVKTRLSRDEYRLVRRKDAARFEANIAMLTGDA